MRTFLVLSLMLALTSCTSTLFHTVPVSEVSYENLNEAEKNAINDCPKKHPIYQRKGIPYSLPKSLLNVSVQKVTVKDRPTTLAVETTAIRVPDPDHKYLLRPNPDFWTTDDFTIKVNPSGFLETVKGDSKEESGEIIKALGKTAASVLTFVAGGGAPIVGDNLPGLEKGDPLIIKSKGKVVVEPVKPEDFKSQKYWKLRFLDPTPIIVTPTEIENMASAIPAGKHTFSFGLNEILSERPLPNSSSLTLQLSDIKNINGKSLSESNRLEDKKPNSLDSNGEKKGKKTVNPEASDSKEEVEESKRDTDTKNSKGKGNKSNQDKNHSKIPFTKKLEGILVRTVEHLSADFSIVLRHDKLYEERSIQLKIVMRSITLTKVEIKTQEKTKKEIEEEIKKLINGSGGKELNAADKEKLKKLREDLESIKEKIKKNEADFEKLKKEKLRLEILLIRGEGKSHPTLGTLNVFEKSDKQVSLEDKDNKKSTSPKTSKEKDVKAPTKDGEGDKEIKADEKAAPPKLVNKKFKDFIIEHFELFRERPEDSNNDSDWVYFAEIPNQKYLKSLSTKVATSSFPFIAPDFQLPSIVTMKRSPFVKVTNDLTLVDGIATSLVQKKPSGALAIANVPLALAEELVKLPTNILELRFNITSKASDILEKEKSIITTKEDIAELLDPNSQKKALEDLQAQLAILKAQKDIDDFGKVDELQEELDRLKTLVALQTQINALEALEKKD